MLALKEHGHNSAIVPELAPAPGEQVVRKSVPVGLLRHLLGALARAARRQTLLVAGCVTSGCVRASVVDAMWLGFRPLVVSDCVGDRALGPHAANLFDLAQKYADVMNLEALYTQLPA